MTRERVTFFFVFYHDSTFTILNLPPVSIMRLVWGYLQRTQKKNHSIQERNGRPT